MDALSFAMGERAASLRVKHLRDLVHGAHIGQPVQETSSVALRYCDDEDRETVFCRTIAGQFYSFSLAITYILFIVLFFCSLMMKLLVFHRRAD